jgi:hypothetical protein
MNNRNAKHVLSGGRYQWERERRGYEEIVPVGEWRI